VSWRDDPAGQEVSVERVWTVIVMVLLVLLASPLIARLQAARTRVVGGRDAFDCSLRVLQEEVGGLGSHWRAGIAHTDDDEVVWRRWPIVTSHARLRVVTASWAEARKPRRTEYIVLNPRTVVVPVRLDSGARLELAVDELRLDDVMLKIGR
jgi:uncharacterized protein DUF2550